MQDSQLSHQVSPNVPKQQHQLETKCPDTRDIHSEACLTVSQSESFPELPLRGIGS